MSSRKSKPPADNTRRVWITPIESLEHPIQRRARLLVEEAINKHQWGNPPTAEDVEFSNCFGIIGKLKNNRPLSADETALFYKKAFTLQCEREAAAVKIYQSRRGTPSELLRKAARFLGWSKDNSEQIRREYESLTFGSFNHDTETETDAVSGKKAYEILAERHGFTNSGRSRKTPKKIHRQAQKYRPVNPAVISFHPINKGTN